MRGEIFGSLRKEDTPQRVANRKYEEKNNVVGNAVSQHHVNGSKE